MTGSFTEWEWIGLSLAAAAAAAMNAVAGGGTFCLFPLLVAAGLEDKTANATNNFVLWIGSLTSAGAYWGRRPKARIVAGLVGISIIGSLIGAACLLAIPAKNFRIAVPWLLLGATIVFAFGPQLARRTRWESLHHHRGVSFIVLLIIQGLIGVYGGFFGAGIGVLMLALFGAAGMRDIHAMNALKAMLATLINGTAAIAFVVAQAISWQGYVLAVSSAAGGYLASRAALRIKPFWVRRFALTVAVVATIYYFVVDIYVRG